MVRFGLSSRGSNPLPSARGWVSLIATVSALWFAGCSGVAPSKTASGAGTGAAVGGLGGAVVGSNSSMGSTGGAAIGAAGGAIVGGLIGLVQDAKDRREQERLAQERAYMQDHAKRKAEEARRKVEIDEELAIAQGFRISDLELNDAKKKLEERQEILKKLQAERAAALGRKRELDEAHEKTLATEAEIARLEEELTRLKGEEVKVSGPEMAQKKDAASAQPAPARPGS